jgi:hypothetical protein
MFEIVLNMYVYSVCGSVYLIFLHTHSVSSFISAQNHFSLVQIRDMKLKAIARLWQGFRKLITRDRKIQLNGTCLLECLDCKVHAEKS